jgi:hypothetical protein
MAGRSVTPTKKAKVLDGMGGALLQVRGRESARICWQQSPDIFQRLGVPEAETVRLPFSAAANACRESRLPKEAP